MASPATTTPIALINTISPTDDFDPHELSVHKARRYSSNGGGRAWSEEEEVYLLQTRMQKMPYKHIASHLKKTELACRLHYHQLSHGTSRRKRAASTSSTTSTMSPAAFRYKSQSPKQTTAPCSVSHSPDNSPVSPERRIERIHALPNGILSEIPCTVAPKSVMTPPPVPHSHSSPPRQLKLDCNTAVARHQPTVKIDKDRLFKIYSNHSATFWRIIAAEYGESVDPAVLEESFRKTMGTESPPTPATSPREIQAPATAISCEPPKSIWSNSRGFEAVNVTRGPYSAMTPCSTTLSSAILNSAISLPTPSTASTTYSTDSLRSAITSTTSSTSRDWDREQTYVPATSISAILSDAPDLRRGSISRSSAASPAFRHADTSSLPYSIIERRDVEMSE